MSPAVALALTVLVMRMLASGTETPAVRADS